MRENRTSGSEGGDPGYSTRVSYPYQCIVSPVFRVSFLETGNARLLTPPASLCENRPALPITDS